MRISVIIPTLNESAGIATTLANVRGQNPFEIIVVDGGSNDDTVLQAAPLAEQVLVSPPGRALQMNRGAAQARGEVFLFLHADCLLGPGALADVARVLSRKNVAAGCFTMRVPLRHLLYRSIEYCASARVRLFGVAYGDQGLFLAREKFQRLGRFPAVRLMEDVYFSLRLRKHGRFIVSERPIIVSPRRWQKAGPVRQTLRNWALTAAAAAGVHPDRLARYYPVVR